MATMGAMFVVLAALLAGWAVYRLVGIRWLDTRRWEWRHTASSDDDEKYPSE